MKPNVKSMMRQLCKVGVKNVYTSLERIFPKYAYEKKVNLKKT
jgi:hypothetical protein